MPGTQLQGTIFKKCDIVGHKPASNKACGAGTCQHTCANPDRCPHAWTLRYSVNGKQREESFKDQINPSTGRVKTGSGKRLAMDAQLQLSHGKRAEGATFVDKKAGNGDFIDAVLAFIDGNRGTKPQTQKSYRHNANANLVPVFGGRSVAQVAGMRDEVDHLVNVTMIDRSLNHRRITRNLITGTLDAAVAAEKIARHRCAGIDLADKTVTEDEHEESGFVHISDAQVKTLADGGVAGNGAKPRACQGVGLTVWLQRTMGLRISEALGVEKSDFTAGKDGRATLRLKWQASRDGNSRVPLKHRKAGQYRDIPVPAFVWAMIKDLPEGPLCPGTSAKYMRYATVRDRFIRLTKAMGLEGFTTHSLRHAYATESLADGMNVANLSKILGHANPSVTLRIYVHETADYAEDARTRMDARWSLAA